MKKKWPVIPFLALAIAGGVFAEEYTFDFDGTINESVTIQKDRNGKITGTQDNGSTGVTAGSGHRKKPAVTGNTLAVTNSSGQWEPAEGDGNTKTAGESREEVIRGDRRTFLLGGSGQYRYRVVIEGNTIIRTLRR